VFISWGTLVSVCERRSQERRNLWHHVRTVHSCVPLGCSQQAKWSPNYSRTSRIFCWLHCHRQPKCNIKQQVHGMLTRCLCRVRDMSPSVIRMYDGFAFLHSPRQSHFMHLPAVVFCPAAPRSLVKQITIFSLSLQTLYISRALG
jgi:hypothetical protein